MIAITLALLQLGDTPKPRRYTPAVQEAIWAAQRALAPFELRLQRVDGSKSLLASGGRDWVVISPERIEDFGMVVNGDPAVYAPRPARPPLAWHIAIEAVGGVDSNPVMGEPIAWPGGDLRRVQPADVVALADMIPLNPGDMLGYAPAERLLVRCRRGLACDLVFRAGRFRVKMVFQAADRPIIRTIAADLRRCLPQWDGRRVDIAAPKPGCA
ncbi:hypothetical protein [Sandarakinorhabdus sp.]|uniref:hypothetical protein n=1 Tax=Sandarakinorhabdus sp. TaxID=1916663 RepID=UPI00333EB80C